MHRSLLVYNADVHESHHPRARVPPNAGIRVRCLCAFLMSSGIELVLSMARKRARRMAALPPERAGWPRLPSRKPVGFEKRFTALCSVCLAIAIPLSVYGQRGLPPREGIVNFGQVSDIIYRGAQPDAAAVKNLQRLGVKTIIDLRMPDQAVKAEAAEARANGLAYTNVPMRGLGRPSDTQVKTVLSLIEAGPAPVFIHCAHGCDRTGTIIACYRIRHDRWSPEAALKEARKYGLSPFERGMRRYIAAYEKSALAPDNSLTPFAEQRGLSSTAGQATPVADAGRY